MDWREASMTAAERRVTEADILSDADYQARRKELRAEAIAMKKNRRVEVGPFATFYFENYTTMWLQVQEMLRIEKGGKDQIAGELEAYNPLIPQGSELIATLMLEIEDGARRDKVLRTLGNIEEPAFLDLGGERIKGAPTEDEARTTPDGKTSSVHWLRYTFTHAQIVKFKVGGDAVLGFSKYNYGHMAEIPPAVRAELA